MHHCNKACKPAEWTETWPKADWPDGPPVGRDGQPVYGTGEIKLKPGTGCVYTREKGSGCCLLPTNGAVQPSDLAVPEIFAKRVELLEKAQAAGQIKVSDKEPDDKDEY